MNIIHFRLRHLMFYYRQFTRHCICLSTASLLLAVSVFSFLLYFNISFLFNFYYESDSPDFESFTTNENIIANTTYKTHPNDDLESLSEHDRRIKYHDFNYLKADTLTYEKRTYAENIPLLFRLPHKVPTKALLLIFHGCGRSAHDWFHTVERQRIVGAAIDLGFACLAFQATDASSHCWSQDVDVSANLDVLMVHKVLEGFYKEYPALESLPRYSFGASSGGMFSSIFATNQKYRLEGQILFISFIVDEVLQKYVKDAFYPATAWIYGSFHRKSPGPSGDLVRIC